MKRLALLLCLVSVPAFAQVWNFDGVNITGTPGGSETGAGCTTVPGGCQICGLVSGPQVQITCPGSGFVGIVPSVVINGGVQVKSGEVPIIVGYFGTAPPLSPYYISIDGGVCADAGTSCNSCGGSCYIDGGLVGSEVACEWVKVGINQASVGDAGFAARASYALPPACTWTPFYADGGTGGITVTTTDTNLFLNVGANVTAIGNAWCCGQHATP